MTISTVRSQELPRFTGRSNELDDGTVLSTDCRPNNAVVFSTKRPLRGPHFIPSHSQTAKFAVLQLRGGLLSSTHKTDRKRIDPIAADDRRATALQTTSSKEIRP